MSVIVKPRQLGGPEPLGDVAPWDKKESVTKMRCGTSVGTVNRLTYLLTYLLTYSMEQSTY